LIDLPVCAQAGSTLLPIRTPSSTYPLNAAKTTTRATLDLPDQTYISSDQIFTALGSKRT
jgi:hypothetical protein